jgi:hypothetical protein
MIKTNTRENMKNMKKRKERINRRSSTMHDLFPSPPFSFEAKIYFLSLKYLILSSPYFSYSPCYQEQNESKNAQKHPADLPETTNNSQEVALKPSACPRSVGTYSDI